MNTAEVLVFTGGELEYRTLTYFIPDALSEQVQVGAGVVVPLLSRQALGVVLSRDSLPTPDETLKPILAVLNQPLLSGVLLSLTEWLTRTQLCSPAEAVQTVLPSTVRYHLQSVFVLREPLPTLRSRNAQIVAETLRAMGGRATLEMLQKRLASAILRPGLNYLRQQQFVETFYELAPPPVLERGTVWVEVIADSEALEAFFTTHAQRATAQSALLTQLLLHPEGRRPERELLDETGVSVQALRALEARGLVRRVRIMGSGIFEGSGQWAGGSGENALTHPSPPSPEASGEGGSHTPLSHSVGEGQGVRANTPLSHSVGEGQGVRAETPLSHSVGEGQGVRVNLTPAQAEAVQTLRDAIQKGGYQPFLLYGVTGSGKTEVYLRASAEALRAGRTVLFLVPEIALTAQLSQRFRERFGESVAVLHSQLKPSERYAQWLRIYRGQAPIVVGARSALFAPLQNVGLIIVDEEHEPSYKQNHSPAYHARRLAEMRAREERATLLLGSATPAIETFHRAQQGELTLLNLPERIGGLPLPSIELIDLRGGRFQVITPPLLEAIRETVRSGRQVMLFLNRRGFSPILLCRECGHVPMCPNCSVALTYHKGAQNTLRCHHCGHQEGAPRQCPSCQGLSLLPFGIGTQRVEATLREKASDLRIARLDRDTVSGREGYLKILQGFRAGELDVLIGTQMIARGLDFPRVGLVGVISADTGLHLPDFRAGERTFHLLMQVAGRAGRHGQPGRALVQTYNPQHPAIAHAQRNDYLGFYQQELAVREMLLYPPFCRLVNLVAQHTNPTEAEGILNLLSQRLSEQVGTTLLQILGPTTAPLERVAGNYRYHMLLKFAPFVEPAESLNAVLNELTPRQRAMLTVDIDPIQLL